VGGGLSRWMEEQQGRHGDQLTAIELSLSHLNRQHQVIGRAETATRIQSLDSMIHGVCIIILCNFLFTRTQNL